LARAACQPVERWRELVSTQQQIQALIIDNLNWTGSRDELTDDYPLIEKHVIDSLGMLKLIPLLEDAFGIEVDDEDLVPTNFGSIGEIASFVEAKRE
jgi:acyl carrier protein